MSLGARRVRWILQGGILGEQVGREVPLKAR